MEFLGSHLYIILSSVVKSPLTPSFPVCILLFSFIYIIVLTKTSISVLNRYGESGQSCLVPDVSGNALTFSI